MHDTRNITNRKTGRAAEEIHRILGDIFLRRVPIKIAGLLTVIKVKLSRDKRTAQIFLSTVGAKESNDKVLREIIRKRNEIRFHLAQEINAKFVPELRFHMDDSLERSAKVFNIIKELHMKDKDSE